MEGTGDYGPFLYNLVMIPSALGTGKNCGTEEMFENLSMEECFYLDLLQLFFLQIFSSKWYPFLVGKSLALTVMVLGTRHL